MTRLPQTILLAGATLVLAAAAERPPGVGALSVGYDIEVGGIGAGELEIDADLGGEEYRATALFNTAGIVGLFIEESWSAQTTGRVTDAGLVPARYVANRRIPDKQTREVRFSGGDPVSVRAIPAFATEPWSVEARGQSGVTDPVTAILSILAPGAAETACGRVIEVFDGQHRFAVEIAEPVEREGRLTCEAVHVRRAGYEPEKMGEDARRSFTLVFRRRDDGLVQVARVETETPVGRATMRLRE